MILVTGGTGFLGSHLLRLLIKQQQTVRAIYRFKPNIPADLLEVVEWYECDVMDTVGLEEAMKGVKHVYHCAAKVSFEANDRERMYNINVRGTANVVNASLSAGVKKVLHVSSVAALGRAYENQMITEKTSWEESANNSWYAVTKHLAEMEVWRGTEEGLPAIIVNPSVIIGACDWNSGTGRFFKMMRNGFRFYPNGANGFVSVKDVTECMVKLMNSSVQNELFILNGDNLSYYQFFTLITKTLSVPQPRYALSPGWVQFARIISDVISLILRTKPFLTRETANTVTHRYAYSSDKVSACLNYKFESAEEFVTRTARQYKEGLSGHS
jgi:nucleoside-diphosphate-sugar epimerase